MDYPTYLNLLFYKSTTLNAEKVLDGTENNYIGVAQAPLDIWCKNNAATTYIGGYGTGNIDLTTQEAMVDTAVFTT